MSILSHRVSTAFTERFGSPHRLFRAPGRVNLIGEHTDYSEGLVMPAAIDKSCFVAAARNHGHTLRVFSLNRDEGAELPAEFEKRRHWSDYVAGVWAVLSDAGIDVPGADLVIGSDVPEGAGVSSSAALEVSVMLALLGIAGVDAGREDLARWAQLAESTYVGMPCGIMDQFVATNGIAGHALQLDCRTLTFEAIPLPAGHVFLVVDSQVRHKLTDGGYAARRADCEAAARHLGVRVLRDATLEMVASSPMPKRLVRRARHVITENQRVRSASSAITTGNLNEFGRLMTASHASLRDDFNVTCAETDALASIAANCAGVLGARQMGGGFGGAVLVLARDDQADEAGARIAENYADATGLRASSFICTAAGGASELAE